MEVRSNLLKDRKFCCDHFSYRYLTVTPYWMTWSGQKNRWTSGYSQIQIVNFDSSGSVPPNLHIVKFVDSLVVQKPVRICHIRLLLFCHVLSKRMNEWNSWPVGMASSASWQRLFRGECHGGMTGASSMVSRNSLKDLSFFVSCLIFQLIFQHVLCHHEMIAELQNWPQSGSPLRSCHGPSRRTTSCLQEVWSGGDHCFPDFPGSTASTVLAQEVSLRVWDPDFGLVPSTRWVAVNGSVELVNVGSDWSGWS